jgi:DnaJ-class molecular chaperone
MLKGLLENLEKIIHILEIIYEYINSIVVAFAKSAGISGKTGSFHLFGTAIKGFAKMPAHQIIFTSFVAVSSFAAVTHSADVTSVQHDLNESVVNSSFNNTTYVTCSYCNGTGQVKDQSIIQWVKCDDCSGTGYIDNGNQSEICPNCDGKGEYEETSEPGYINCPVCGGTGKVPRDGSNETN